MLVWDSLYFYCFILELAITISLAIGGFREGASDDVTSPSRYLCDVAAKD